MARRSSIIVPNPAAPGTPQLLAKSNGQTEIDLTAFVPGRTDTVSFLFQAASSANGPWSDLGSTTSLPVIAHSGLKAGQTVFYRVRIRFGTGRMSYSPVVSATTAGGSISGTLLRWWPGHWGCPDPAHNLNDWIKNPQVNSLRTAIDAIAGNPYWAGVWVGCRYGSYDQGATGPDYTKGRIAIQQILDYALSKGVKVGFQFEDRAFGNTQSSDSVGAGGVYPPWWPIADGNTSSYWVPLVSTLPIAGTLAVGSTSGNLTSNFGGFSGTYNMVFKDSNNNKETHSATFVRGQKSFTWSGKLGIAAIGSLTPSSGNPGSLNCVCTSWRADTMNKGILPLLQDLQQFRDHPAFVALGVQGETAIAGVAPGLNYQAYFDNSITIFKTLRQWFPEQLLRSDCNYGVSQAQLYSFFDQLLAIGGVIIGGPDPLYGGPNPPPLTGIGHDLTANYCYLGGQSGVWPIVSNHSDYKSKMAWVCETQAPQLYGGWGPTPSKIYGLASQMANASFYIWTLYSGFAGFSQSDMNTFVNSIQGACNRTPPNDGQQYTTSW